jgi:hypothetical protein
MNLARLYREQLCPACGYKLEFMPWKDGKAKEKPCPCCGIHFGHDDVNEEKREATYLLWRERWIDTGRRWWSAGAPPSDFNPPWQLARLESRASLK